MPEHIKNTNEVHENSLSTLDRIAIYITDHVGTMECAGVFSGLAILGLLGLLNILDQSTYLFVQWISQTFLQLVLLSVIMVGQNLQGRHSEFRAENDYEVNIKAYELLEEIKDLLKNK